MNPKHFALLSSLHKNRKNSLSDCWNHKSFFLDSYILKVYVMYTVISMYLFLQIFLCFYGAGSRTKESGRGTYNADWPLGVL